MDTSDQWGSVDVGDLVVVRAVRNAALDEGFGDLELEAAVDEALDDRDTAYDFVVFLNTSELPTMFYGAEAFHRQYNSDGVSGIGRPQFDDPDRTRLYFSAAVGYAAAHQILGSLPFLILFQAGFLYTGVLSLLESVEPSALRAGSKVWQTLRPTG